MPSSSFNAAEEILETLSQLEPALAPVQAGPLTLEVYGSEAIVNDPQNAGLFQQIALKLEPLLQTFYAMACQQNLFEPLGLALPAKTTVSENTVCWLIELTFVDNDEMQALNQQYRHKNQPTDVLSFPLLDNTLTKSLSGLAATLPVADLPLVSIGQIFISLPWALEACAAKTAETPLPYVLERVIHGLLHVFGQHHDTEEDYQAVCAFQQQVLAVLKAHVV